MGTETIATRTSGQTIKFVFINIFRDALIGHLVPRQLVGAPSNAAGRIGSGSFKWKRLEVAVGHASLGDVLAWYDYSGTIAIPQGWMLCDGSIVNQANYDTQHVAGDWALWVQSSSLSGKYLPNFNSVYAKAKVGALQAGSSAITTTGTSTRNLSHAHGSPKTTTAAPTTGTVSGAPLNLMAAGHTHSVTVSSALSAAQDIRPLSLPARYLMRIV